MIYNCAKTHCITFGKCTLTSPKWYIGKSALTETESISYLGVTLANSADLHVRNRISATKRAFYALQGAGLFKNGLNPATAAHIWNCSIRPILLYGIQVISPTRKVFKELEQTQSKLLKTVLGVSKFCRTIPLLDALKIHNIC